MCNQNQQQQTSTQAQPAKEERTPLDVEIRKAEIEVQLATLRQNAAYNASVAGQMQRQFETYQRIAVPLAESDFVPSAYKGKIGNCVIAVEMAARLGVLPLTVMQNLCVVNGTPTWKAKFLIGCVNSCGRYTTLDYRISIDGTVGNVKYKTWEKDKSGKNHEVLKPFERPQLDNLVCVAYATEKATGKELASTPVSIRMAIEEGWYMKSGSKWPTMPGQMLRYRAASFWVSAYAPEMAMGLRTEEEQRDIVDVEYEDLSGTQSTPAPKPKPTSTAIEEAKEKLRNRGGASTSGGARNENKSNPANEMP